MNIECPKLRVILPSPHQPRQSLRLLQQPSSNLIPALPLFLPTRQLSEIQIWAQLGESTQSSISSTRQIRHGDVLLPSQPLGSGSKRIQSPWSSSATQIVSSRSPERKFICVSFDFCWYWGVNLGFCMCQVNTLLLSYSPSPRPSLNK